MVPETSCKSVRVEFLYIIYFYHSGFLSNIRLQSCHKFTDGSGSYGLTP